MDIVYPAIVTRKSIKTKITLNYWRVVEDVPVVVIMGVPAVTDVVFTSWVLVVVPPVVETVLPLVPDVVIPVVVPIVVLVVAVVVPMGVFVFTVVFVVPVVEVVGPVVVLIVAVELVVPVVFPGFVEYVLLLYVVAEGGKVVFVLTVFEVLSVVWLSDVETVVDAPVVSVPA